jgi:hypothetical protein
MIVQELNQSNNSITMILNQPNSSTTTPTDGANGNNVYANGTDRANGSFHLDW